MPPAVSDTSFVSVRAGGPAWRVGTALPCCCFHREGAGLGLRVGLAVSASGRVRGLLWCRLGGSGTAAAGLRGSWLLEALEGRVVVVLTGSEARTPRVPVSPEPLQLFIPAGCTSHLSTSTLPSPTPSSGTQKGARAWVKEENKQEGRGVAGEGGRWVGCSLTVSPGRGEPLIYL